jgi:hypothetical protein
VNEFLQLLLALLGLQGSRRQDGVPEEFPRQTSFQQGIRPEVEERIRIPSVPALGPPNVNASLLGQPMGGPAPSETPMVELLSLMANPAGDQSLPIPDRLALSRPASDPKGPLVPVPSTLGPVPFLDREPLRPGGLPVLTDAQHPFGFEHPFGFGVPEHFRPDVERERSLARRLSLGDFGFGQPRVKRRRGQFLL